MFNKVAASLAIHALQTSPYLILAGLLQRYEPIVAVTAILVPSALMLAISNFVQFMIRRPQVAPKNRLPADLIIGFIVISSVSWFAYISTIGRYGPAVGVITMLSSGMVTIWLCHFFLNNARHRSRSLPALLVSTLLVATSAGIIIAPKLDNTLSIQGGWRDVTSIFVLVASAGLTTTLKILLSDRDEANSGGHRPLPVDAVAMIEIGGSAIVMLMINFHRDGLSAMIELLPHQIWPLELSRDQMSFLWIATINIFAGNVIIAWVTNLVGVQIVTTVGQARPIIIELQYSALGLGLASNVALLHAGLATPFLLMAAILLIRPKKQKA
jgi:hypothetical protein